MTCSYVAFALSPITREERVQTRKGSIFTHYGDDKLRGFLDLCWANT
jgi:type I restriction enzyme, R subunit